MAIMSTRKKDLQVIDSDRRTLLAGASGLLISAALTRTTNAFAASNRVVDVSNVSGVDPTGTNDSTSGFQTALTTLQSLGGGELYIPPGNYKISSSLTYSGPSLTIFGSGQTLSVLNVANAPTVFSIVLNTANSLTVKDIGFYPASSGGTAFQVTGSSFSETQNFILENVDFCVEGYGANAVSFAHALILSNLNRSNVRNVNMNANTGGIISGGSFASISNCVDIRFNNCSVNGSDIGFFVSSYSEGLHINDCVIICNTGLYTGSTAYNKNVGEINLLGLYISNSEFNCAHSSASLNWVNTAWITGTHFSTGNSSYPAMSILGCQYIIIDGCEFTGQGAAPWTAIEIGQTSDGWATAGTKISNSVCSNIGIGISLQLGTYDTAVTSWTMVNPSQGGADLIGGSCPASTASVTACIDNTGNTTNLVQWITSVQPSTGYSTDRQLYSRSK